MSREYHVSVNGCDHNEGSVQKPFRTISKAASIVKSNERVIVHEGVYREWVNPANGGASAYDRIIYEAAEGEKVIIKGSEEIKCWEREEGTVWKAVLSNSIFGDFNPYEELLEGDWLMYPEEYKLHLGDVYLNGKSFFEAHTLDEVKHPMKRVKGYNPPWTNHEEQIQEPEQTVYTWFAETDCEYTTIYANFHEYDPNEELVEINVRPYCFYPKRIGLNYITVRGFEMAQAACPWAPPTADQPGLLGPHWSKGWIIEDNIIHDAKCSGISIGKEMSTGHNLKTRTHLKPGYQYQLESVFLAIQKGWTKENVGSHIIRNNKIYNCGQNGIVGHMGCAFSEIYGNHIYNIGVKHEFFGYEIAGIKLHAAVDVQITGNNIHNTTLGMWLDWQAQGTRISRNLFYKNARDFMIEVTHGPCMVDNNIFGSDYNIDNQAQGTAFVHNLCCGTMRCESDPDRSTPYHFPHSTQVAGYAVVYGGDDRVMQNIFIGNGPKYTEGSFHGTYGYNKHVSSMEEYLEKIMSGGIGDMGAYLSVKQPVYIKNNSYLNGAQPYNKEENKYVDSNEVYVEIEKENDGIYLKINIPENFGVSGTKLINSQELGTVRIVGAAYETSEGKPLCVDVDYFGEKRGSAPMTGPFENLKPGQNILKIWKCSN